MIKAKKEFGQNFLKDGAVLEKIIQSIPNDVKNLVEIGAGLGDLTRFLVKICKTTSYEIDKDLIEKLEKDFAKEINSGEFILINSDVLKLWDKNLQKDRYFLCANLPYNVATKIILKAFDDENCDGILVMTQKEVAQKFTAKPKNSNFSSLAIIASLFGEAKILFDVAPSSFVPSPKVFSSVFILQKSKNLLENFTNFEEYLEFKEFLKICFSSPRKTLRKNLLSKFDKEILQIDDKIRPHESDCLFYIKIFKMIKAQNERESTSNKHKQK